MNYKHIFHAGNFADVIKHLVLIIHLKILLKKEKEFTVLDCFAGNGKYDLTSEYVNKTGEINFGINKLKNYTNIFGYDNLPASLKEYAKLTNQYDKDNYYPGSPLIINQYLRDYDKLIAVELHKEEYTLLKKLFYNSKLVATHNLDAYLALKAFTPFKSSRGLIFIDPPFEVTDEFDKIATSLQIIYGRILSVCTIIWYPIKCTIKVNKFYNALGKLRFKEIIKLEYQINFDTSELFIFKNYLKTFGILIINPPNIKAELTENITFIKANIYDNKVDYTIDYL